MMKVKKDVKDLNPIYLNFLEVTRLFINDTLRPSYMVLWNKHKNLRINEKKRIMFVSKTWRKKVYITIFKKYRLNATP